MLLLENSMPKVPIFNSQLCCAWNKSNISLVGLYVIATARTKDAIIDLEEMGMSTLSLEVTSKESIADARMAVEKLTGGKLDILVNNAYEPPMS